MNTPNALYVADEVVVAGHTPGVVCGLDVPYETPTGRGVAVRLGVDGDDGPTFHYAYDDVKKIARGRKDGPTS